MKKHNPRKNKYIISACVGTFALLLVGFSACDFQPAQELGRVVGGGLAQGRILAKEFLLIFETIFIHSKSLISTL